MPRPFINCLVGASLLTIAMIGCGQSPPSTSIGAMDKPAGGPENETSRFRRRQEATPRGRGDVTLDKTKATERPVDAAQPRPTGDDSFARARRIGQAPRQNTPKPSRKLPFSDVAPNFIGEGLNGETVQLKQEAANAEYVLLDFWASWCGPCRKEFPYLREVHDEYADRGLRIIGVNLDKDRQAALRAIESAGLDYSHVFDGLGWRNAVAVQYNVRSIPQTLLLDRELNVIDRGLRGKQLVSRLRELFEKIEARDSTSENPLSAETVSSLHRVGSAVIEGIETQAPVSP